MARSKKTETPLKRCKEILEDFFLNVSYLPICSENCRSTIDYSVADYLTKMRCTEFLSQDISHGPMVGGVSERVLIDFYRDGRIFEGKAGRYKIQLEYGPWSVKMFRALPVKKI